MRISDWSSDVCSSDVVPAAGRGDLRGAIRKLDAGGEIVELDDRFGRTALHRGARGEHERPALAVLAAIDRRLQLHPPHGDLDLVLFEDERQVAVHGKTAWRENGLKEC